MRAHSNDLPIDVITLNNRPLFFPNVNGLGTKRAFFHRRHLDKIPPTLSSRAENVRCTRRAHCHRRHLDTHSFIPKRKRAARQAGKSRRRHRHRHALNLEEHGRAANDTTPRCPSGNVQDL